MLIRVRGRRLHYCCPVGGYKITIPCIFRVDLIQRLWWGSKSHVARFIDRHSQFGIWAFSGPIGDRRAGKPRGVTRDPGSFRP
jgi:hypothetical protein